MIAVLPPVEQLWKLYCDLGSVHKIEIQYGHGHARVHRALLKAGYRLKGSKFTAEDDAEIRRYYAETLAESFSLIELTALLRRPHHTNVSRRARQLGLTDQHRAKSDCSKQNLILSSIGRWDRNPHPKGMLGKKHTPEVLTVLGQRSAQRWAALTDDQKSERTHKMISTKIGRGTLVPTNRHKATWKAGWREIGGKRKYFRSQWEANYACYLEWLKTLGEIKEWEHEAETFWFHEIKRGSITYLPDFRVTENNGSVAFHEVKGWMDDRSKIKLKRMAKYYPHVRVVLIDASAYKALSQKVSRLVPGWTQ